MTTRKIQVLQNGAVKTIESENEEIDFQSVRVGADKLTLSQLDADTFSLNGKKLRVADGTNSADVATKSQLDTAANSLQSNLNAVETSLEGQISALDADLQGQIDDAGTNFQGQINTINGTLTDHGTRITTAEGEIDNLQGDLAAILANNPQQGRFLVGAGGATTFDLSTLAAPFEVDADNEVLDVEMWVNGARWVQCTVGDFSTGGFRKNSTSVIETSVSVPENAEVIFWKQGTSSAGSGGGGSDLTAITQAPRPAVAGGLTLGTLAKPWAGVYIKDTATSQVYLLQVVNGAFELLEVS